MTRRNRDGFDIEAEEERDTFDVPDVSVLMSVYNEAETVKKMVDSVTKDQPGILVEVLVIDDASTDNTVDVLKTLSVEYTVNRKNKGKSANLNELLKRAKGRYVIAVDGDDWIEPNALTILVGRADDLALSIGNKFFMYGNTQYHGKSNTLHRAVPVDRGVFFRRNPVCSVILVPREAALATKVRYNERYSNSIHEDWLYLGQLVKDGFTYAPIDILVLHYVPDTSGRYQKMVENNADENTRRMLNGK